MKKSAGEFLDSCRRDTRCGRSRGRSGLVRGPAAQSRRQAQSPKLALGNSRKNPILKLFRLPTLLLGLIFQPVLAPCPEDQAPTIPLVEIFDLKMQRM